MEKATVLTAMVHDSTHIMNAKFSHYNSRVKDMSVKCKIKMDEDDDSHGGH